MGVDIDLLTYGEGQDVDLPGVRIIRIPRFAFLGNVKTGPSALKLFLDIFIILWTLALLIRNRYDFVHAHEEAVFFSRFLKPIFRFKLIYDMHSSLPQQLTNFNFSKSKALIGIFKWLEDTCIYSADAVITICPALADYVDKLIGKHEKHLLIENSIFDDVKLSKSSATEYVGTEVAQQAALDIPPDKKLVVYTGTLESYQGIEILIGSFKTVLASEPNAYLLIVGGSPQQVAHFSAMVEQKGIADSCMFTGRVPQKLAKYYNSIATVIMSPRSAGTNTPLKVYEQLASGIPLVATRIYSHTQVLDDNVAFLVEPNTDDMAQGITTALVDKTAAESKVANAKKLYQDKYSRQAYEGKMRRLLELVS
jgi:glycosyltransferase involved in cell wall biosynthesis